MNPKQNRKIIPPNSWLAPKAKADSLRYPPNLMNAKDDPIIIKTTGNAFNLRNTNKKTKATIEAGKNSRQETVSGKPSGLFVSDGEI